MNPCQSPDFLLLQLDVTVKYPILKVLQEGLLIELHFHVEEPVFKLRCDHTQAAVTLPCATCRIEERPILYRLSHYHMPPVHAQSRLPSLAGYFPQGKVAQCWETTLHAMNSAPSIPMVYCANFGQILHRTVSVHTSFSGRRWHLMANPATYTVCTDDALPCANGAKGPKQRVKIQE